MLFDPPSGGPTGGVGDVWAPDIMTSCDVTRPPRDGVAGHDVTTRPSRPTRSREALLREARDAPAGGGLCVLPRV